MPRGYRHLGEQERDLLAVMRGEEKSLREIAQILKRAPSSLSRELYRNAPPIRRGRYLPHKAHARYKSKNQQRAWRPCLKSAKIRRYVGQRLAAGWSPELIAGRMALLWPQEHVSHEAIYGWIYVEARQHIPHLVRNHRRRQRRGYSRKHAKPHIPGRICIEDRPAIVETRRQMGHWEADTVVSRQSKPALQVMVERKARYTRMGKMQNRSAREMRIGINRKLSRYPASILKTITYDNGTENTEHLGVNAILGTRSYFCTPFHSWERGTVENTIGLVRRWLPKKTNFATVSSKRVKAIGYWLNHRPRKCLNYKTPAEVFRASVALTP